MPVIPQNSLKTNLKRESNFVATSWDIGKIFDEKRFPAYTNGRALKAPDQYIIGVGDEISVTVFGNSHFNKVSRVDECGSIDLRNRSTGLNLKTLWRTVVGVLRASGVKF